MPKKPLTKKLQRRQKVLKSSVIREFGGGWNVIDNDLNLGSNYSKIFRNVYRAADGSVQVRFGTRLFADIEAQLGNNILGNGIVNSEYFNTAIICVGANGNIAKVLGDGTAEVIFDETLAYLLPGNPTAWAATAFASFAASKSSLLVSNGIDKPLIIDSSYNVQYLQDLATGSNFNVPIGRYIKQHLRYTVIAGDPLLPSTIHISNLDTSGTWLGDADPNDAVQLDLGGYITDGDSTIIGLGAYRDKLVVLFPNTTIIVVLGEYNDSGEHVPRVEDVIEQHGCVAHRSVQPLGDDMLYSDIVGVPSIERALFTGSIKPSRASELIDPEIQKTNSELTFAEMDDRIFSAYNKNEGQYMLFIPDDAVFANAVQTRGFVYSLIKSLSVKAWAEFAGWKWSSGCRSSQGRMFFTKGSRVYIYGDDEDPISADEVGYQDIWSDGTTWSDNTGFTPASAGANSGLPISFVWELPWADFDKRAFVKQMRYIAMDTKGTGRFTIELFVDNIYEDLTDPGQTFSDNSLFSDGSGWKRRDPLLVPTLSMDFLGGDSSGFGSTFGRNFGAGRISSDERLFGFTTNFKIAKLRVSGKTRKPLRFISIGFMYQDGSIRR